MPEREAPTTGQSIVLEKYTRLLPVRSIDGSDAWRFVYIPVLEAL